LRYFMKHFIQRTLLHRCGAPLWCNGSVFNIIIRRMHLTDSIMITNLFSKKYKHMRLITRLYGTMHLRPVRNTGSKSVKFCIKNLFPSNTCNLGMCWAKLHYSINVHQLTLRCYMIHAAKSENIRESVMHECR